MEARRAGRYAAKAATVARKIGMEMNVTAS